MTRRGAAAAVISAMLLGGCAQTEPATDVGATGATLHATAYCPEGARGAWRYAYREVGAFYWQRTPDNPFSCSRRIPSTGPMDLPVAVSGLRKGAQYVFRFEVKLDDGRIVWWDATGRAGGTSYARFSTTHPEVTPVDATAFRDSIGVNLHLSYFGTVYERADRIGDEIRELGIRHARQGIWASSAPEWRDWNRYLYDQIARVAARGVKYSYGFETDAAYGTVSERLSVLSGRLAGTAAGLEGPNEPDLFHPVDGLALTRSLAPHLYTQVKFHPDRAIRALPVTGPSFGTADGPSTAGDLSKWVDYGNIHPYTGCTSPNPRT
jgi:hypothetical protein